MLGLKSRSSDSGSSGSSAPSFLQTPPSEDEASIFNLINLSAGGDGEKNSGSADAIATMFGEVVDKTSGSRLGISYVRAQKPILEVLLGTGIDQILTLAQDVTDEEAISGVVWDAGLLMIDYLVSQNVKETREALMHQSSTDPSTVSVSLTHMLPTRYMLDLGCGTGVVGIVASELSTPSGRSNTFVYFSDKPSTAHLAMSNMATNRIGRSTGVSGTAGDVFVAPPRTFIAFDWLSGEPPPAALCNPLGDASCSWDTIYCSDVLYDDAVHGPLMQLLHTLQFKKVVFSYKKRYPASELSFFQQLSAWCDLCVVPIANAKGKEVSESNAVQLLNCSEAMTTAGGGLFIVEVTPRLR